MNAYDMYPVLEINLSGIFENAKRIVDMCSKVNVKVTGVVKGTDSYENSYAKIANGLIDAGCISIGDSRINTIKRMREMGFTGEVMLIRIPMLSEVVDVVKYTECSLNSEMKVIKALHEEAEKADKIHCVILMADLGDLREGYFNEEELIDNAVYIENHLKGLKLYGIGTNLGCYGAIKPDINNTTRLAAIAKRIEDKIKRPLDIVSGGASSTLPCIMDGMLPNGINHLRIGESLVLARDMEDIWGITMPHFNRENYKIIAEIIEIKEKPSYPIGEIFVDAFGNTPNYIDKGVRRRALLALGKRDIGDIFSIIPKLSGITVEGGSSDHTILDITDCSENLKVGDTVELICTYGAMIHSTYSSSVVKVYI